MLYQWFFAPRTLGAFVPTRFADEDRRSIGAYAVGPNSYADIAADRTESVHSDDVREEENKSSLNESSSSMAGKW